MYHLIVIGEYFHNHKHKKNKNEHNDEILKEIRNRIMIEIQSIIPTSLVGILSTM